jgi:hypothetical protein
MKMINLTLSLINPWHTENFKNLFCRSGLITEHKAWEFEVCRYSYDLLNVSFQWKGRTDHAGPSLELALFGYSVSVKIYDTRHWDRDCEKNCREVYDL